MKRVVLVWQAALLVALCGVLVPHASAQSGGHWLVLPYGIKENREAIVAAELVQVALQELDLFVLSSHEARDRYVTGSRAPENPAAKDLEVLIEEGQQALEHVAHGRHAAAQKSVREALARAEGALETLNRKTETARSVLDACLILVRSELGQDKRELALETAMRCRRLVPDVSPSQTKHPASVIGVVAEAENRLRRLQAGKLSVVSTPRTGCSVYVNGRHLGLTPFVLDRAAEGAYRVQVECDHVPGRVHEVTLGEKPVNLTVDSLLDSALTSEPRLSLLYDDSKLGRAHMVGHATEVGKQVRADDVVLVAATDGQLTLLRVQVSQGRAIAEATIPRGATSTAAADLERGLEALLAGRTVAVVATPGPAPDLPAGQGGGAVAVEAGAPADVAAHDGAPEPDVADVVGAKPVGVGRTWTLVGRGLGGVGVGALIVGWGFELRANALRRELRDTAPDDAWRKGRQDDYDRARGLTSIGAVGAVLMTAAVPLLLPEATGVPWWSYLAGGAGVALATAGAVELAISDRCIAPTTEGGCLEQRSHGERGVLLIASAVPLIAVPVTHALRLAWREQSVQIGPRVAAAGHSLLVGAEGTF